MDYTIIDRVFDLSVPSGGPVVTETAEKEPA